MKVGNSLGVTVPAGFVKSLGVVKGNHVQVQIKPEKNQIVYTFDGICQLPLSDILKKSDQK